MLTRYRYTVITADSGQEAVRLLERRRNVKIDLAIVDLVMLETNAVEVIEHIQKLYPRLPVIHVRAFLKLNYFVQLSPKGFRIC